MFGARGRSRILLLRGVVALWATNGTHYILAQKSLRACASNSPCMQKHMSLRKRPDQDYDVTCILVRVLSSAALACGTGTEKYMY